MPILTLEGFIVVSSFDLTYFELGYTLCNQSHKSKENLEFVGLIFVLEIISLLTFWEREKPIDRGFVSGSVTYLLHV